MANYKETNNHKKDMVLHFNCPATEEFKVFYKMIKDNVVKCQKVKTINKIHHIGLTDKEFKIIMKLREKEQRDFEKELAK